MADKKIFINFSENDEDKLIAEALVKQIRATGMFRNQDIHDRGTLTGGEEEQAALTKLVTEDDAVVHLLSAYFFQDGQECYRVWNLTLGADEAKIFPVRIREFLWEKRSDLQRLNSRIIPGRDKPVGGFSGKDASAKDSMLTETVKQIFEGIEGVTYQDKRGQARPAVRIAAIGIAAAGAGGAALSYMRYSNVWLSAFILALACLLASFLFSMLRTSGILSLSKSVGQ